MTTFVPYLLMLAALMALGSLIARRSAFFRALLSPAQEAPNFQGNLDGLRGVLAASVFIHHGVVSYFYHRDAGWVMYWNEFLGYVGPNAVQYFFFLTAFLFWSRLIKAEEKPSWRRFFAARCRRLVPAYVASVILLLGVASVDSGQDLRSVWLSLASAVPSWLSFGFIDWRFADVAGVRAEFINSGIAWSIRIEVLFYALLPLFAWFARGWRLVGLALLLVLGQYLLGRASLGRFSFLQAPLNELHTWMLDGFLYGMAAALLVARFDLSRLCRTQAASVVAVGLYAVAFFYNAEMPRSARTPLLGLSFLIFAYGNDCWGLFNSLGARLLGRISYSVYLLHGIVLFVVFRAWRTVFGLDIALCGWQHWLLLGISAVLVLAVSALCFRFVEYPFIAPKATRLALLREASRAEVDADSAASYKETK